MLHISWSFLCETRRQEKGTYCRLVKKSSIWVDKEKLASVKDKSSSVKKYARALMWKVLITANDLLEILEVKETGSDSRRYLRYILLINAQPFILNAAQKIQYYRVLTGHVALVRGKD